MTALLATERLDAFYGASQVLHGITLTVQKGEQVALMGRNGMGKTTLLRAIMGLGAQRRGQILIDGRDVCTAAPETIARCGVALVPEGRGVFGSLIEVQAAIKRFIAESNGNPKPFVWTADPDRIIQAAKRGHQVLDSHH